MMIKLGVVQVLIVWLIMYLFNLLSVVPPRAKDVVNAVVIVLLIIALLLVGPVFQVAG